jgi:hypothetical protein
VDAPVHVTGLYGTAVDGSGDDIGRINRVRLQIRTDFRPQDRQPFPEIGILPNMITQQGCKLSCRRGIGRGFQSYFKRSARLRFSAKPSAQRGRQPTERIRPFSANGPTGSRDNSRNNLGGNIGHHDNPLRLTMRVL